MTKEESGSHRFGVDSTRPCGFQAVEVECPDRDAPNGKAPANEEKWFVWGDRLMLQMLFAKTDTKTELLVGLGLFHAVLVKNTASRPLSLTRSGSSPESLRVAVR